MEVNLNKNKYFFFNNKSISSMMIDEFIGATPYSSENFIFQFSCCYKAILFSRNPYKEGESWLISVKDNSNIDYLIVNSD